MNALTTGAEIGKASALADILVGQRAAFLREGQAKWNFSGLLRPPFGRMVDFALAWLLRRIYRSDELNS
jgi:hypothetical protein